MIYNYTKCESVIAKIMADLDISEKNIRITDIREWIFEAVDKIGAPMLYIQDEKAFEISDRQVPIPSGLQAIDGVAYAKGENGPWVPMRSNTAIFKQQNSFTGKNEGLMSEKIRCNADLYTINGVKYLERSLAQGVSEDPTYFIKPGWIVTNQSNGYVKIAYKCIATDERGYPLIPDMSSYQEAVYWYVVMKLSFPKYLTGKLGGKGVNNAQNTYFYIQQQWNFYRNQAYAECMMPTADEIRSIKNDWNSFVPNYNSDNYFFKDQGAKQTMINDYYYGY